ncbi:MAG: HAD hydrolase family protein [Lachnospiraceae bacterium]|nr:HAD hydrolase family protein [Lachnospiraceae bacterium]
MKTISADNTDLIVYDFDGVMTDNRVSVDQDGKESVCVNRSDGYGVGMIRKCGIPQIIISTEKNPVVERRAEKLSLPVIHDVADKAEILKAYLDREGIDPGRVLYVGNDLNDREAMLLCGIKCAPADAEPAILKIADVIFERKGGYGVVRELAAHICGE